MISQGLVFFLPKNKDRGKEDGPHIIHQTHSAKASAPSHHNQIPPENPMKTGPLWHPMKRTENEPKPAECFPPLVCWFNPYRTEHKRLPLPGNERENPEGFIMTLFIEACLSLPLFQSAVSVYFMNEPPLCLCASLCLGMHAPLMIAFICKYVHCTLGSKSEWVSEC